jgi:hypothetical protein
MWRVALSASIKTSAQTKMAGTQTSCPGHHLRDAITLQEQPWVQQQVPDDVRAQA